MLIRHEVVVVGARAAGAATAMLLDRLGHDVVWPHSGRVRTPRPVACLTAGLANIAAARGVRLTEVRSTVAGDIDLNGILGLDPTVRNGYEKISVRFSIKGDAPAEVLKALIDQSRARSAVFDSITNQVRVAIEVDAG